ncbi:MAG: VIT1/CCC1 transporter family protein [Candidatus Omnitrophota bacterium]
MTELDPQLRDRILKIQQNEITEYLIYKTLAAIAGLKQDKNKAVLEAISNDELSHYNFWKNFTQAEVAPQRLKVNFYLFLARTLGLSFSLKLMESGEENAQLVYGKLASLDPQVVKVMQDEERHEQEVLALIDEERLKYTGSIILGLNDALVELTGALSGFTLALQKTKLIAVVGLITGIAAALSMAGSEYLSTKEEGSKSPVKACVYTGIAYIFTVILLILPFFIFQSPFVALGLTVFFVACVIFIFTFYVSVAKGLNFKTRFFEMLGIALGVAILNFFIGLAVKKYLHIDA